MFMSIMFSHIRPFPCYVRAYTVLFSPVMYAHIHDNCGIIYVDTHLCLFLLYMTITLILLLCIHPCIFGMRVDVYPHFILLCMSTWYIYFCYVCVYVCIYFSLMHVNAHPPFI